MPYTVAAKLAAKLGCDLHAPVPIRGTQALYDEIARQIANVAEFKGVVDAEVGNENWNGSYNARDWLGGEVRQGAVPAARRPGRGGAQSADVVPRARQGVAATAHP
jgi:hypothetical protein